MKRTTPPTHLAALLALLSLLLCACGGVKRIDLQNPAVPIESRRLIADAEDALSIARARLDDALQNQARTQRWDKTLQSAASWPSEGGANANFRQLAVVRLQLADLGVELARNELELAEAKHDLTTAETAIRHDLAIYELEPLRDRTEIARVATDQTAARIEALHGDIDDLTAQWWQSYAGFVRGGGESHPFFTSFKATQPLIPVRAAVPEKKEEIKEEDKGDGEAEEPKE